METKRTWRLRGSLQSVDEEIGSLAEAVGDHLTCAKTATRTRKIALETRFQR